ncbi:MAG: hypothetical protein JWL59_5078 [Chthoniobacteraceae bacterium]|nr:hypothetical protein [Chthoniobacteraceae bacterium]
MSTASIAVTDPGLFLEIDDLELAGRGLADTVWLGRHQSVLRGSGVEFHSHRAYERGDDLRLVNWALYARHRRLFIRESRQESRRPVYLLVDSTGSMGVRHGPWSKFHYAARIAAALAHLASSQGDAPALGLLQERLHAVLKPRPGTAQTAAICAALAGMTPSGPGDPARALADARHLCRQRGFVVLISDFFDKENLLLGELAQLRAQGHDVLALQILDPIEAELPLNGDYEFLDVEGNGSVQTSTEELHRVHARVVADWRASLRAISLAAGLRWESVTTADPLVPLLRRWLA